MKSLSLGVAAAVLTLGLAIPAAADQFFSLGSGPPAECARAAAIEASDAQSLALCSQAVEMGMSQHNKAVTRVNRGIIYIQRGNADAALRDFAEAERLDASVAEIYTNRGTALLQQGDFAGAVRETTRGLAMNPDRPARAHYVRGWAYEELGDPRAAYRDYVRASQLAPEWSLPRLDIARFRPAR